MPVMKCANGKWKIGKGGKCQYDDKATADRAYKGYLGAKYSGAVVSRALLEQDITLTPNEAKAMLDARIRSRAKFEIRYTDENGTRKYSGLAGGSLGLEADKDELERLTTAVYDDLVSDLAYSDTAVKAMRSVGNFDKAYVRRVLKAGIKSGVLVAEAAAEDAVDKALEAFGQKDGTGRGKGRKGGGRRNKNDKPCPDGGPGKGQGGGRGGGKNR